MLDHVMARAARRSIGNISPHLAAADALPFPDARFDAAYLVTVLGEIPARRRRWRNYGACSSPAGGWSSASSPTVIT